MSLSSGVNVVPPSTWYVCELETHGKPLTSDFFYTIDRQLIVRHRTLTDMPSSSCVLTSASAGSLVYRTGMSQCALRRNPGTADFPRNPLSVMKSLAHEGAIFTNGVVTAVGARSLPRDILRVVVCRPLPCRAKNSPGYMRHCSQTSSGVSRIDALAAAARLRS